MENSFAEELKKLRKKRNLNQRELAKLLNFSPGAIGLWETGKRTPDLLTIKKIADFFEVEYEKLAKSAGYYFPDKQGMIKVPIIGTIRAGLPILANENITGYLAVPDEIRADFALEVIGDSMKYVGISEGDYAICRRAEVAKNRDIVAALKQGEFETSATLKFYLEQNGKRILRSANPKYEDIEMGTEDRIIGVVVEVYKRPPDLQDYYELISLVESYRSGWNEVVRVADQHGIGPGQVAQLISLFSQVVKQIK